MHARKNSPLLRARERWLSARRAWSRANTTGDRAQIIVAMRWHNRAKANYQRLIKATEGHLIIQRMTKELRAQK